MNEKNCQLCGMLIQEYQDYCSTCAQLMGVENSFAVGAPTEPQTFASNNPVLVTSAATATTFNSPKPLTNFSSISKNSASPNSLPQPSPTVSKYKAGLLDWFWDLPTFVKLGAAVFLGAIIFGLVLKAFMTLDVSIVKGEVPVNLEPQKPWFSAWLRSNPTPEEIFEKYEKETHSKGKSITAQTYLLKGTVNLLKALADDTVDLGSIYKNKSANVKTQVQGDLSYHNSNFEIYLKQPNKWVLRTETDLKPFPNQNKIVPMEIGFDGTRLWGVTKMDNFSGGFKTQEVKAIAPVFYNVQTLAGISLAFQNSSFSKLELVGEEIVFNRRSYNIKATNAAGVETNLAFDIENGLITKVTQKDLTMLVIDHQDFDGVLYPSKFVYKVNKNWILLSVDKIEPDAVFGDSVFMLSSF